jgi:hypothetical protein
MRKFIMAMVLLGGALAMSGCFTFDPEHNRTHWKYMKTDIRLLHEDLDFILAMDEESPLDSYYR